MRYKAMVLEKGLPGSLTQLVGVSSHNQKVASLIPGQAHAWVVDLIHDPVHMIPGPQEGNGLMFLSHIDLSLSL